MRTEAATTVRDGAGYDYQGVALRLHQHLRWAHLELMAPAYLVHGPGGDRRGAGDVTLAGWIEVVRRRVVVAGVGLPVSLPTGSAEQALGMGHVMVMPTVYAGLRRRRTTAVLAVGYHRGLGVDVSDDHEHGAGPIVNPMSVEELGVAAEVGSTIAPRLRVLVEGALAIPIDGEVRALVGIGASWRFGALSLKVRFERGVAERPFGSRGVLDLGYAL